MRVIDLLKSEYDNKTDYTNYKEIEKIIFDLGFKLKDTIFYQDMLLKEFILQKDEKEFIVRMPTTYDILSRLHDNFLNRLIKTKEQFEQDKKDNQQLKSFDKYESCNENIKSKLKDNQIIEIKDLTYDEKFQLFDYDYFNKYHLRNTRGQVFFMDDIKLNINFGL